MSGSALRQRLRRGAPPWLVAALGTLVAGSALATPTDPLLLLTSARSSGGSASVVVQLEGSFHADDLVQLAYPLQLLVRETATGTGYVRYDMAGVPVQGVAPELADGLGPGDVAALLAQGEPAPGAGLVLLGRERLEVRLPPGFPSGNAEAQLFVVHEGVPILSNALPFAIEAATRAPDPALALTLARGAGVAAVELQGAFPGRAPAQLGYPLQILIRETGTGVGYLRYDVAAGAVRGVAPELADGLDPEEAVALLSQGTPAPDAVLLALQPDLLQLQVPTDFPSGPAEAQVFVVDEGIPVVSGALPLVIQGSAP